MKKITLNLSVFLILINSCLFAQTIELNNQSLQFVDIKLVQPTTDGRWLLTGNREPSDSSYSFFAMTDSIGSLQFNSEFYKLGNIEKFTAGNLTGHALDKKDGKTKVLRYSLSASHSNLAFATFPQYPFNGNIEILNLKPYNNGRVIVVGRIMIGFEERAYVKVFGNSLWDEFEDYTTAGYFNDVIVFPDSSFMVTGSFGDSLIYGGRKFNKEYEWQEDILEGIESDQFFKTGDGYFILRNKTITKLGSDFQIENSINLENYGERIDMDVDDENAFVLFQNEEEAPMILKINDELDVVDFFAVGDKYFRVNDIHLSESEIGLGGFLIPNVPFNNTPFLYPSTSGYFKTFPKNGITQDEDIDLEIIAVKIEDYEKIKTCGTADLADAYLLNLKNIKVSFVNNGSTTINNISLFTQVKGIENCETSSFEPKYHTQSEDLKLLHLEPGDTIHWRISSFEFSQKNDGSTSVELCVWHTSVENRRDQNHGNNYFCGEVELKQNYDEPPIVKPTEGEVLIYPNPLDEVLIVSLLRAPFVPTLIEFYDYMGRELELKYFIAPRAQYKEFDISQLPTGFYFIRISNDRMEELIKVFVN